MQAKTIAQVRSEDTTSLWDFIMQLPGTLDAQIWYALLIGGAVGMILHYAVKLRTDDITGSPLEYFMRQSPWRTVGTIAAMASWAFGEVLTGIYVNSQDVFIGWGAVLLSGVKTGYLGDSIINKGERAQWSEAQREAATNRPLS